MKVLALVSQKGGSGKTTIAVHLAVCAILRKKLVALIDLDPQGSAIDWYQARQSSSELAAVHAHADDLPDLLKKAEAGGADFIIIDTAPHSDKAAAIASKYADLIFVPCRPSRFDLKAMQPTFEIIKITKTPAFVVMNVCPRGKLAEDARDVLRAQGFPVLDVMITQRVAFSHAVADGRSVHEYEPGGAAAENIEDLFNFIEERLKL